MKESNVEIDRDLERARKKLRGLQRDSRARARETGWGILALDPGETTGVAFARIDPDEWEVTSLKTRFTVGRGEYGQWIGWTGQIGGGVYEQGWKFAKMVDNFLPNLIVVEDFLIRLPVRTTKRSGLSPVRYGAVFEFLWEVYRNEVSGYEDLEMTFQLPSEALSVVTDERLKRWGLWVDGPHARDAVRHLVTAVRKWM